MRDIKLCVPELREAWQYSQAKWSEVNTGKPQPVLTCTLRTSEEQTALYAQGRFPTIEVNRLRKLAGLTSISSVEAKKIVTRAQAGQSKHNPDKLSLSHAFDIAFINLSSGRGSSLNWDTKLFEEFYKILLLKFPNVVWGGTWTGFKDYPHFETRG